METIKAAVPSDQKNASVSGMRGAVERHPILAFVVLACAFSWLMTLPFILWEWGKLPGNLQQWSLVFVLKAYAGPFLAAYLVTRITEGKEGWARLRRRIGQWREGRGWYLFILVIFPLFLLAGLALVPGAMSSFTGVSGADLTALPLSLILIAIAGGPLAEEPGWRGFLLPRLLDRFKSSRYTALKASLILSAAWTFWHLPDFLTSAQHGGPDAGLRPFYANLPVFFLLLMFITIIFTWVYNRTHGSIFMAILLHAVLNTAAGFMVQHFPAPVVTGSDLPLLPGLALLAFLIVILTGGQLGYPAE